MMKKTILLTCGVVLMLFSACGRDGLRHFSAADRAKFVRDHNLRSMPKFDIPIVMNDRVIAWMDYFQGTGRKHYVRYLERSGRYLPLMRKILKEDGLPQDLVYIALIESGFNNHAYSRAKATGSWQFMYRTGLHYGLKVDSWVDERRDPVKATHAAGKYFRNLYNEFGDWYLAMAGYNAGEGRVRKAIRMTGSKNFWQIIQDHNSFRAETRDYVPKFIAAAIIAKKPKDFGFGNIDYHDPVDFEEVFVDSSVDFEVLAKCADTDKEEIANLNPELIRGVTPPYGRTIKIPRGRTELFTAKLAEIPKEKRVTVAYHTVRRGETLGRIARKYKVKLNELMAINSIKSSSKIYPGQRLLISSSRGSVIREGGSDDFNTDDKAISYYTIKSGDTLGTIAGKQGISVAKLRTWNNLGNRSKIFAGRKLKIYKSVPRKTYEAEDGIHVVKSGETLSTIAGKYKTTTSSLVEINNIADARFIKVGQKIVISKANLKTKEDSVTISIEQQKPATVVVENTKATKTYYTVKKGDTVSQIAGRYGVKSNDVLAWNNLKSPRNLIAGKRILIIHNAQDTTSGDDGPTRLASADTKTTVSNTSMSTKHKIKSGESLYAISQKYDVEVKDIMIWNNIKNPKKLQAGQTLVIRKPSQVAVQEEPVVAEDVSTSISSSQKMDTTIDNQEWLKYQIKPGDTLWNISKNFGVTIAQIKQWNELTDASSLRAGDMIAIYKPSNN